MFVSNNTAHLFIKKKTIFYFFFIEKCLVNWTENLFYNLGKQEAVFKKVFPIENRKTIWLDIIFLLFVFPPLDLTYNLTTI
jgi:hypothetical protein